MLIFRIFLYLICFLSLMWSALIFVGPVILKSLISHYSNGQLVASKVVVTPKLDFKIGRLNYDLQGSDALFKDQGFSRSIKISWSIFGDEPFLQAQFGPTFFEDTLSLDYMNVYTPPFSEIDYKEILVEAEVDNLNILQAFSSDRANFKAVLKRDVQLVQEAYLVMPLARFAEPNSWNFRGLSLRMEELDFSLPFDQQLVIIDVAAAKIENLNNKINLTNFNGILDVKKENVDFKLRGHTSEILGIFNTSGRIDSEGSYSKSGFLRDARLEFSNASQEPANSGQFRVSIDVLELVDNTYEMNILGALGSTNLVLDQNFIGNIPASNFEIYSRLSSAMSEITATTHFNMKTTNFEPIRGSGDLTLKLEKSLLSEDCLEINCKLLTFNFDYEVRSDRNLFVGSTTCRLPACDIASLSHNLKTSNTVEMFNTINQLKILNPLYSFYLYSFIVNGKKVGSGHEIKIN